MSFILIGFQELRKGKKNTPPTNQKSIKYAMMQYLADSNLSFSGFPELNLAPSTKYAVGLSRLHRVNSLSLSG